MNKEKKLSTFRKGLLIYIAVFVLVAVIALAVLYDFLRAYELSRPETAVKDYINSLLLTDSGDNTQAALGELDANIQGPEESVQNYNALVQELSYRKDSKRSSQGELFYNLYSGDQLIGTVSLKNSDKKSFGLTFWEVADEDVDLSGFTNSVTMSLPVDYKLFVNGYELGENYITDKNVEYETLSGFYEHFDSIPTLVSYESGKFIGDVEVVVKDGNGNEVAEENLNEVCYLNNCDADTTTRISEFADEFINRYVFFCANTNKNEYANYDYLYQMVKPESPLQDRMYNAFWAFGYTTVYSCDIISRNINLISDLGNYYLVDYSYTTETVGSAGPVAENSNVRFLISDNDDTLLAEAIYNY